MAATSSNATSAPATMSVHRDLAYVANGHPRQALDLYLPNVSTPAPLIVWIHGGAFRMGSKEDRVPLEYVAAGYGVASINYRLSQHAVFPAQIEDCKAAVRWLRAHAHGFAIDPERFGVWGESAGGHLAAMLGTAGDIRKFDVGEHLEQSSRVQAVADHFGPTDFLQMDAHRLPDGMLHDPIDSPESQLVGGAIQAHPELVAAANPVTYASPGSPPFLIVHGDRDPLVPYHQSELLAAALRYAGVETTFYTVRGEGHGNFKDPMVRQLTSQFFQRWLRP